MNVLEYTRLALAHGANPFYTKYLAGRRVLDIGAGEGDFVARDPARFVGIDIEPRLVEHCRTRGLDVRAMSALRLEFADQSFEAVHAAQVIEHFNSNDAAAFLQEASRVLMPGGVIVLTTPGVRNVWDTFSHVRPYTPTALRKFCASETESYIRDGSNALVFEGAWGTRRYVANKTLFFLLGLVDFAFKPRNPIGWTIILRKRTT